MSGEDFHLRAMPCALEKIPITIWQEIFKGSNLQRGKKSLFVPSSWTRRARDCVMTAIT